MTIVPNDYIELNMSNYDETQVERLNDWAIQAHSILCGLEDCKIVETLNECAIALSMAVGGDAKIVQHVRSVIEKINDAGDSST